MKFDKLKLAENFNNKNYDYCIEMLRTEIIEILTYKVKEKNPKFVYTTIRFFKTKLPKISF